MTLTKTEALSAVDQQLSEAGMASYSDIVALLKDVRNLGLTFHIGSAYISRAYIDRQTELDSRIDDVVKAIQTD